jgi:signal transduction histidine kinase/ligand-binding sensor domain-containing protein/CheY-like chemotaxis protein
MKPLSQSKATLPAPMMRDAGQQLRFSHLTVENGLSHPIANIMAQDPQGFIWIATIGGLNRFDGHEVKVFKHNPDNPNSLSNDFIETMIIDQTGIIWIGTYNGLNKFDPYTEIFTHYQHQPDDPRTLGFNFITSLYLDQTGLLWVGGPGELDQFNPQTETFVRYRHHPDDPTTIGPGQVFSIREDYRGTLWLGQRSGGGLNWFDRRSQQFGRYNHKPDDPHSISDDSIYALHLDRAGELWVGTENGGLNRFNRATNTFTRYQSEANNPDSLSDDFVRDILEDQVGRLWVTTADGLNQLDRTSHTFSRYRHNPADPASLSSNNTSRLFEDRTGGLWVTTFQGVNYCSPKYQQFRHYRHEAHNPNSLDAGSVSVIYEDTANILWVGTSKGLNKVDRARRQVTRYQHDPDNPTSLSACKFVNAILEDQSGKLWIGTVGGGLNYFDPQTEQFWLNDNYPVKPHNSFILSIAQDHQGDIWVGDRNQGVYRFAQSGQCLTHYPHHPDDPHGLSANTVRVIYVDRTYTLWVGTETGGLNCFDWRTETFSHYRHDPQDPTSISSDWVRTILEDQAGNLWIGTQDGLNRLDRKTGNFRCYGKRQGLTGTTVNGLLEDETGKDLWLSTFGGLLKFNPQTETFQDYDATDGVQKEFSYNSCYKSCSGELFFGGLEGLTAFHPEQIIDNDQIPPVVITNFLLFNEPVSIGGASPLQQAIWATQEIILSDQDYNFAFEFAALNYVAPERNRYKYKLEGFDQEWNQVHSRRRYAAYTNLPAGEYIFRVLGSTNHGVWNEEGASIKIKVAQPWWEKLRLEKEAAEAANLAKSTFLANMSHELRTPLNAILGFAQVMQRSQSLDEDNRDSLSIIIRSGEHLLTLINQVLDLSKIEAGRVTLDETDFSLTQLLNDLEDMFALKANEKGLQFLVERDEDVPEFVRTDEVKLRQVLINLLSNAFKFTQEGGVVLRVRSKKDEVGNREYEVGSRKSEGNSKKDDIENTDETSFLPPTPRFASLLPTPYILYFEVSDTGPGIAPDEIDQLFESFAQTETGRQIHEGTGLGLPISRKFVQLMGGDMSVSSEVGQGTIFKFNIHCQTLSEIRNPPKARRAKSPGLPARAGKIQNRIVALAPGQPRYRLLIVDDDPTNRQLLIKLLAPLDFELREAENGQQAIEIWEKFEPHLIWMDMRMPVLNGYEATRQIKAMTKSQATTIIALTASSFEEERATIMKAGCDDFLRKPFREADIFSLMEKHLGIRFIYAEPSTGPLQPQEALSPADLALLPPALLSKFYRAVKTLDLALIEAQIEKIGQHQPHFVAPLTQFIRNFRFAELLALIEETQTNHEQF